MWDNVSRNLDIRNKKKCEIWSTYSSKTTMIGQVRNKEEKKERFSLTLQGSRINVKVEIFFQGRKCTKLY